MLCYNRWIILLHARRNVEFAVKSSAFGQGIKRIVPLRLPYIRTFKNAPNCKFKRWKNIATNTNKIVLEYLTFGDYLYACLYDSILKDFTLYKQYTNQRFFPKENPRNSPLWTKAWKGCLHTVSAPLSATCGNCSKKSPSSFAGRTASYYTPT